VDFRLLEAIALEEGDWDMGLENSQVKGPGYSKELLVLPFDHRGSFQEKMFGIHGKATEEQTRLISSYKTLIFEGFEKAVKLGLPREKMGVLVDEQFGIEVIQRARKEGFTLCLCVEKSGQEEFDFEYGAKYGEHIEKYQPDLVKVLVRYNPEGETTLNRRQAGRLVELSQYLRRTNRKFMFELLVPATPQQLEKCKGDKKVYDLEIRPSLMIRGIQELQKAGVEADVWKLEGLDRKEDWEKIVSVVRAGGRDRVGCILLGRGENADKVAHWLTVGAKVDGVIGFAVGRTVWWDSLKAYKEQKITRDQAADQIAKSYADLCQIWLGLRKA
jgi:myo-inositol catabolism protein IolC